MATARLRSGRGFPETTGITPYIPAVFSGVLCFFFLTTTPSYTYTVCMDNIKILDSEIESLLETTIEDDYYGLPVVSPDGDAQYAIARTEEEATAALRALIGDNIGCLRPRFLSRVTGESEDIFREIENRCTLDEAEEELKPIVERTCGEDALLDAAVKETDRLHLACYDYVETVLSNGMMAYRIM